MKNGSFDPPNWRPSGRGHFYAFYTNSSTKLTKNRSFGAPCKFLSGFSQESDCREGRGKRRIVMENRKGSRGKEGALSLWPKVFSPYNCPFAFIVLL